jgi:phage terminase small subunit
MPDLTIKQERFCQAYIENGGNASEAYRTSYDASNMKPESIHRKAHEVMENGKVTARLEELRQMHVERHCVTVDSISTELEEARALARDQKQAAPMVSASMGKAKLHGLIVDKAEHTGKDGKDLIPELSDLDRARRIAFILAGAET